MNYRLRKLLGFALILLALTGCKLRIDAPVGGSVTTESGAYSCASESTCNIDIYDVFFNEKFIAIPDPNFYFVAWKKKKGGFCGGKALPCHATTTGFPGHESLMKILESDAQFYLEPLFAERGRDSISLANFSNYSDVYAIEAAWRNTNVFEPHIWEKAHRIAEYFFREDQFIYIAEIWWWGYYTTGELPRTTKTLNFRVTFDENDGVHPGNVIVSHYVKMNVEPKIDKYSGQLRVVSRNPNYDGKMFYEYRLKPKQPLYVPRGDAWVSIVQLVGETLETDPNFVWHGSTSDIGRFAFLTDYGGWINRSYPSGLSASDRLGMKGYMMRP